MILVQERCPTLVRSAGRHLRSSSPITSICFTTVMRSHMSVVRVDVPSRSCQHCTITSGYTVERSPLNVKPVVSIYTENCEYPSLIYLPSRKMLPTKSVLPGPPKDTRRNNALQMHGLRQEFPLQGLTKDAQMSSTATGTGHQTVGGVVAEVTTQLELGQEPRGDSGR